MSRSSEGKAEGPDRTYERAVRLLAVRGRSVFELRRRLLQADCPAAEIDLALERLTSTGVLDDATYARQVVRYRAVSKGESRRRVMGDLRRRGIAEPLAKAAIAEVFEDEAVDEDAGPLKYARKRLRALARYEPSDQRRRLFASLAQRGFDGDTIRRVVAAVMEVSAES